MMNLNFLTLDTITRISANATDFSIHYAPNRGDGKEDYRIRVSYANNYGASIIKRVPIDDSWAITVLKKNWLNYVTKSDAYSNNPGGLRGAGLRVRTALKQSDISIMTTFYSKDE